MLLNFSQVPGTVTTTFLNSSSCLGSLSLKPAQAAGTVPQAGSSSKSTNRAKRGLCAPTPRCSEIERDGRKGCRRQEGELSLAMTEKRQCAAAQQLPGGLYIQTTIHHGRANSGHFGRQT